LHSGECYSTTCATQTCCGACTGTYSC
jgi:hypothetical protein